MYDYRALPVIRNLSEDQLAQVIGYVLPGKHGVITYDHKQVGLEMLESVSVHMR